VAEALIWVYLLGVGLRCDRRVVEDLPRHAPELVRAATAMWLLAPLFALIVVSVAPIPPLAAAVILTMSVCPGLPVVGRHDVAISVAAIAALTGPLFLPVWLSFVQLTTAQPLELARSELWRIAVMSCVLPLGAGIVVCVLWPRLAAFVGRIAELGFVAGVTVLVVAALHGAPPPGRHAELASVVTVIVVTLGMIGIGYAFGGPSPTARRATAVAAGMGNPALALALVSASFGHRHATAYAAGFVVLRAVVTVVVASAGASRARRGS
jgi:predicted Na+-dependent transporter